MNAARTRVVGWKFWNGKVELNTLGHNLISISQLGAKKATLMTLTGIPGM